MPHTFSEPKRAVLLKIAADADVNPRTVRKYLTQREPGTKRAVARAIKQALPAYGIADPHPEFLG